MSQKFRLIKYVFLTLRLCKVGIFSIRKKKVLRVKETFSEKNANL
jgi:hypothetical protein